MKVKENTFKEFILEILWGVECLNAWGAWRDLRLDVLTFNAIT